MARKSLEQMTVASVYPLYLNKVERKGKTKAQLDEIFTWLSGYTSNELDKLLETDITFEEFFNTCPALNPKRLDITGVVCGVRVENLEDSILKEIRYLDLLVDKLSKGRNLEKILI